MRLILLLSFITVFGAHASSDLGEALVKGGDFYVGDVFGNQDYLSHANVKLASFYIMRTEVTYERYQKIHQWAVLHGYDFNAGCNGATYEDCLAPEKDGGKHPVTNIEWLDAVIFANALSEASGLTPVYWSEKGQPMRTNAKNNEIHVNEQANGYRLPTLSEWHVAARGGAPALNSGHYGDRYSGGNNEKKVAWYPDFNSHDFGTKMVGQLSPNALGLYDMSGNVSEWVYDSDKIDNIKMYYFCGGSYLSHATTLAGCDSHSSGFIMPDIGFRLARSNLNAQ
ncbi:MULTISPECIES: SUMF1/EgtB/PvdO family nonheme iron enzyme [unclassified Brenneria]|uniref:SUMF1/EgtB/PvdO family nonheme iron enzyme n=1 Tax=unclassified Brenneria TaxID=2634434 RepID=UPI0029C57895|nr:MULTISPECIES: SUMF1/EgtB/PvdO family nonheme iron enzyme [unclassified Brenneria]MDX5630761.1 SUMF1/EgtB/PvdO family nonheme iron enzyme [Brenneria sp. L3-3Z]MDX5697825.1 SUMF1/EgtB/PvdO family nonheme iron enzyme [Brenneria sp. L4-2C]MEE3660853.1 SUMF1/EgtB/PvdO family nonheme iron enzyme [Brenneria sp. g21c3]